MVGDWIVLGLVSDCFHAISEALVEASFSHNKGAWGYFFEKQECLGEGLEGRSGTTVVVFAEITLGGV